VDSAEWDNYAGLYLHKMGDSGDFWNRELIIPALLRLCGTRLREKLVLDLGCGHGQPALALAGQGAR